MTARRFGSAAFLSTRQGRHAQGHVATGGRKLVSHRCPIFAQMAALEKVR